MPGGEGSIVMTVSELVPEADGFTIDSTSLTTVSGTGYGLQLIPALLLRLNTSMTIRDEMANLLAPGNYNRRDSSKTPVGFAIFFIVFAMLSVMVVLSILLGWAFTFWICVSRGPKLLFLHTVIWFVIVCVILVIVTFTAKFPGWVIIGAIYVLAILSLGVWYLYHHCKKTHMSASEFGSSSEKEPIPMSGRSSR